MCYYNVQIDLLIHVNLHIKQKKHNMVKEQQNLTCTEHGRHMYMYETHFTVHINRHHVST